MFDSYTIKWKYSTTPPYSATMQQKRKQRFPGS